MDDRYSELVMNARAILSDMRERSTYELVQELYPLLSAHWTPAGVSSALQGLALTELAAYARRPAEGTFERVRKNGRWITVKRRRWTWGNFGGPEKVCPHCGGKL